MGFEVDRFSPQPPPELICVICTCVLDDPIQCGHEHFFCRGCITQWLSTTNDGSGELNDTCPGCRCHLSVNTLKKAPRSLLRQLNKLKLKCSFEKCDRFFGFKNINQHEDTCQERPPPGITCKFGCGHEALTQDESDQHLLNCDGYLRYLQALQNSMESDLDLDSTSSESSNFPPTNRDSMPSIAIPLDGVSESRLVNDSLESIPNTLVTMNRQPDSRCRRASVLAIFFFCMVTIGVLIFLLVQYGRQILRTLHIGQKN